MQPPMPRVDRSRTVTGGKQTLVHVIEADDVIRELPNTSKMNGDWDFLLHLHDNWQKTANNWLVSEFDHLGVESSIDFETKYL
jgi:NTE family protein